MENIVSTHKKQFVQLKHKLLHLVVIFIVKTHLKISPENVAIDLKKL